VNNNNQMKIFVLIKPSVKLFHYVRDQIEKFSIKRLLAKNIFIVV